MPAKSLSRDWKSEFDFARGVVFLNHASFGPVTRRGRAATVSLMQRWGRLAGGPEADQETFALLSDARRRFARLIGAGSKRVAFAPNTSYGLNAVLWGMNLRQGERILIPEVEFPAAVYAVKQIAKIRGLHIDVIPCPDGYVTTSTLTRALRKRSAAFVFSWVQYFNGYRYNLEEITEICHAQGCLVLVDAIQGVGAVPLNVRTAGIDALACGGQKWLFGQPGSGFFYIAPRPIRRITPPYAGWLGADWRYQFHDLNHWDRPIHTDGRQWEIGTYPFYAVRFAHAGLTLLQECGKTQVWRNIRQALARLANGLARTSYEITGNQLQDNRSGIAVLQGPRTRELQLYLKNHRIFTAFREGGVRVSPHFHTTDNDIDRLIKMVRKFEKSS